MAKVSSYTCECGRLKDIANRWLLGVRTLHSWPDEDMPSATFHAPVLALRPWDEVMAKAPGVLHFCSDKCALVWQQREIERMGR
jgi:hypothetical protein